VDAEYGLIDSAESKKIADVSRKALRLEMLVFSRWRRLCTVLKNQCTKIPTRIESAMVEYG